MKHACIIKTARPFRAVFAAAMAAASISASAQEPLAGWLVPGAPLAVKTSYLNTANWADGVINGVFPKSLILNEHLYAVFSSDAALDHGWLFNVGSTNRNIYLLSDGSGAKTLTLGGDVRLDNVNNGNAYIGDAHAVENLNLDLGGEPRLFQVRREREIRLYGGVTHGALDVKYGGTLVLQANASTPVNELTELRIGNAFVNNGAYSSFNISGALVTDGTERGRESQGINSGGIAVLEIGVANTKSTLIRAAELRREGSGVMLFRSAKLGGGAPENGRANIFFDTPPAMTGGGGAAGSYELPIIPGLIGGVPSTFMTYDGNGLRYLDAAEMANQLPVGANTARNVFIPGGSNITNDLDTAVNSLFVAAGSDGANQTRISGTGVLHVASGMVAYNSGNGAQTLSCPIDFGSAQGFLMGSHGKHSYFNGPVHGTGGVVFFQPQPTGRAGSGGTPTTFSGNVSQSTFTGDVHIFGRIQVNAGGFLPGGDRAGDVYLNGMATFASHSVTLNGLNGIGQIERSNSGPLQNFFIGGNDADGDFNGVVADGNQHMGFVKIGAGTQRLGGASTYRAATTVQAGTLILDGSIMSATAVESNAVLRGAGVINKADAMDALTVRAGALLAPGDARGFGALTVATNNVAFEDGAKLAFHLDAAGAGALALSGGSITGAFEIPVEVTGEGQGKWLVMSVPQTEDGRFAIEPELPPFISRCKITKEAGGTQVWIERLAPATVMLVR